MRLSPFFPLLRGTSQPNSPSVCPVRLQVDEFEDRIVSRSRCRKSTKLVEGAALSPTLSTRRKPLGRDTLGTGRAYLAQGSRVNSADRYAQSIIGRIPAGR